MTPADSPSRNIVQAIDEVTVGDYSCFAGFLASNDDSRPCVTASALLDDAMRGDIEARFAKRFATGFESRAVHSIWMKWYLNTFIPPILLADVLLKRTLPVALGKVDFIIADDARVAAIRVTGKSEDTTHISPFERFEGLIFDHFEPLIEMWSARTEVTRRVFWSNVGNTFEAMLRRVEAVSGRSDRLDQAQRLLDEPNWRDGRPNPLFAAVHYIGEPSAQTRRRRVCCLQYMLPDRRFCKACPIEETRPAVTDLMLLD